MEQFILILLIIYIIGYVITFIYMLPRIISYLYGLIVCFKKSKCKQDECKFREYCPRAVYTDREKELFFKAIDDYFNEKKP